MVSELTVLKKEVLPRHYLGTRKSLYRIHSVKRYAPYLVSACDSTTLGYIRNIKIGGDVD